MNEPYQPPARGWLPKFGDALGGIVAGMHGQGSFLVHIPAAGAVAALAIILRVSWTEACLLVFCIAAVIGAELMNTALEHLAKAITTEYHEGVRVGLNIASGAVLFMALGAAVVGAMIFVPRLLALLSSSI